MSARRLLSVAALIALVSTPALAQSTQPTQPKAPAPTAMPAAAPNASCKVQVSEKKLAGAAMNSFMKKCETDAQKACDASAAEKKLAGAEIGRAHV